MESKLSAMTFLPTLADAQRCWIRAAVLAYLVAAVLSTRPVSSVFEESAPRPPVRRKITYLFVDDRIFTPDVTDPAPLIRRIRFDGAPNCELLTVLKREGGFIGFGTKPAAELEPVTMKACVRADNHERVPDGSCNTSDDFTTFEIDDQSCGLAAIRAEHGPDTQVSTWALFPPHYKANIVTAYESRNDSLPPVLRFEPESDSGIVPKHRDGRSQTTSASEND